MCTFLTCRVDKAPVKKLVTHCTQSSSVPMMVIFFIHRLLRYDYWETKCTHMHKIKHSISYHVF